MPPIFPLLLKAAAVAVGMYLGVNVVLLSGLDPILEILLGGATGGFVAAVTAVCLDVGGIREGLLARSRASKRNEKA